jgi:hypothetical protein
MDKLTILDWAGRKREVDFVGYNRNHTACLIRNEKGERRAIALHLPERFHLRFRENTIAPTNSPAVKISPVAVHLPACFSSMQEKEAYANPKSPEAQRAVRTGIDAWKVISQHKCWLEPKQDEKLLAMAREGMIHATLEELKKGQHGVREKLLGQEWAEHFGVDLELIPVASRVFRAWLEKHAYKAAPVESDASPQTVEKGVCLSLAPCQWEVLEASVMYEIQFVTGRRCWLDNIEERAVTSPEEVKDFEKLESAQKSPEPTPWHSEGFATIRRCNGKSEVVETLPLSNEFRALCQLLAERPDQIAQFSEIEPQIGTRTRELDIAAQVINPSQKGERRVRDLLRTKTGMRLLAWGVLIEQEVGREKFLKLSPPKPVA